MSRWLRSACLAVGMSAADVAAADLPTLWDVARHAVWSRRAAPAEDWGLDFVPGSVGAQACHPGRAGPGPVI